MTRRGVPAKRIARAALAMLVYSHGEAYLVLADANIDIEAATTIYEQFNEGVPLAAPQIPMFALGAALLAFGLISGGVFALALVRQARERDVPVSSDGSMRMGTAPQ